MTRNLVRKTRTFLVTWNELWHMDARQSLTGLVGTLVERFQLQPRETAVINHVQGDVGVTDDPVDDRIRWGLFMVDPTDLPAGQTEVDNFSENAIWQTLMQWRTVGTGANTLIVTQHINDLIDDSVKSGSPQPNVDLCVVVISNTTSDSLTNLNFDIDRTYRQRESFDDPDDWLGYEDEEVPEI